MSIETLLIITTIIGTVAFSVSGALVAIENKLDLFGVIILGTVTACGGGVLRDVMMHQNILMFEDPWYFYLSLLTGLLVFIAMYFLQNLKWENSRIYKIFFNITDSIGLGTFVVLGANVAVSNGVQSFVAITFYAVLTAVGGGLIRDLSVMKIPVIFRKHIYAVASIIGAVYFYLITIADCPYTIAVITTVLIVVIIRYLAFRFEWSLPRVYLKDNL
ncbi:TPA: trimeric intracellular cation channel family protein [Candidatus Avacholeplasma faecigallinarum]|nr:trimeric intracellular cation channel family protein [Candidatus Avacholeplasma faecigallinarum]